MRAVRVAGCHHPPGRGLWQEGQVMSMSDASRQSPPDVSGAGSERAVRPHSIGGFFRLRHVAQGYLPIARRLNLPDTRACHGFPASPHNGFQTYSDCLYIDSVPAGFACILGADAQQG
jgi:hypothetical protein